jgi:hypothetical protein
VFIDVIADGKCLQITLALGDAEVFGLDHDIGRKGCAVHFSATLAVAVDQPLQFAIDSVCDLAAMTFAVVVLHLFTFVFDASLDRNPYRHSGISLRGIEKLVHLSICEIDISSGKKNEC